jgi:hypothetical protein
LIAADLAIGVRPVIILWSDLADLGCGQIGSDDLGFRRSPANS